jgi:hypothetical protein
MGGQACVFYGAAQFSRDADIAVLADATNLQRLQAALVELQAEVIAVPPFEQQYLDFGLAVHFRCRRPDLSSIRIDVMSKMRGVDPFPRLWERRTTIGLDGGQQIDLMNIADLVLAKKTQRDKDWPMIRSLVDAHYEAYRDSPSDEQVQFWLREGRSPEVLKRLASEYPSVLAQLAQVRPLLHLVLAGSIAQLQEALAEEQRTEQERDRQFWEPLKTKLQELRLKRPRGS